MEMKTLIQVAVELLAPHGYVAAEPERDGHLTVLRFQRRFPNGRTVTAGVVTFDDSLLELPVDRLEATLQAKVLEAVRAAAGEPALHPNAGEGL